MQQRAVGKLLARLVMVRDHHLHPGGAGRRHLVRAGDPAVVKASAVSFSTPSMDAVAAER